jgi:hypothetical protein
VIYHIQFSLVEWTNREIFLRQIRKAARYSTTMSTSRDVTE